MATPFHKSSSKANAFNADDTRIVAIFTPYSDFIESAGHFILLYENNFLLRSPKSIRALLTIFHDSSICHL
jgi:hypothetical protein